jgi:signal transduction histidine kinase
LVDKDKLQQVFINFITNALLAMVDSDNKKLIIRSYITRLNEIQPKVGRRVSDNFRLGERVIRADIEDTGRGISEANMKKIFDPFFSTRGPREGAGLGLAICLNIIDLHKGFIEVESQEGKGSKFTITLKIKEDSQNG